MRSFFSLASLISLVSSACAYQVLTPSNSSGWTTAGPNNVTWQRVNTDAQNFTLLLVNQDKSILPSGSELLAALVDGTTGSYTVSPPSGGYPVGSGFQVNFVKDPQDTSSIYAQSGQFTITRANNTTSPSGVTAATPAAATTAPPLTTDTSGDLNPSSATNTTAPGKNGAERVAVAGSTSLIFAALAAFIL